MKDLINKTKTKTSLETWEKFAKAFNVFNKHSAQKIKSFGLTQPQFSIIEALGNLGSMKIGELNNNMIFNGGNMTLVLDQLEKKGLLRRTSSPSDRRAIIIELTDKGHDMFSEIYPSHVENIENLMSRLDLDEQAELGNILNKFLSN